jgi:predicted dehydrogenase
LKALEKNKDILVEKPLAANVKDADQLIKRA